MRRMFILPAMSMLAACGAIPDARERQPLQNSATALSPRPEARQCLSELGSARAGFTPLADQYYGAGCSTLGAVRLASLQGDDSRLSVSNLGPMTCSLATVFAGWARYGVDRTARQILGSPLARIETMGSYSCRNVAGTDRRSAHASANALDVSGFVLADGRRISVLGGWRAGSAAERRFLQIIRESACKRFGTVLSPDYDAAHRDHLHLELGGGSYCR